VNHLLRSLLWVASVAVVAPTCAHPISVPSTATFEAGFSPRGTSLPIVLHAIDSARQQILVAAYEFTSRPVAGALVAAMKRGVKVFVVADRKANSKGYTAVTFLANEGVPVRLNGHYAILHSKFMVIDDQDIELGSFNYTSAAVSRNEENVLWLRNVAPLARQYAEEWRKLWEEADAKPSNY
jgi:phosphatidylserine/phosphatidylglycerophosphate/cardiolipin synthase-like enzyme